MTLERQSSRLLQLPSVLHWLYPKFLQLLIYPSVWVAGAIASLVFFTQATLGLPYTWQPAALIFSAALLPYNLDRIIDSYVQKIPDQKAQAFFRERCIFLLVLVATATTAFLLYKAPVAVRWVSLGGLMPLIYGIPLFPFPQAKGWHWYRLKDIPGAKAWIVCGTITYGIVAVTLANAGAPFNSSAALTTLFLFIFIGSNSHMFDVRDVESDREKGVQTLPILLGVKGTRLTLTGLNLGMLIALAGGWLYDLAVPDPRVALCCGVVTLTYVWTLQPGTSRNTYNIWIDGYLFLPLLLQRLFLQG